MKQKLEALAKQYGPRFNPDPDWNNLC